METLNLCNHLQFLTHKIKFLYWNWILWENPTGGLVLLTICNLTTSWKLRTFGLLKIFDPLIFIFQIWVRLESQVFIKTFCLYLIVNLRFINWIDVTSANSSVQASSKLKDKIIQLVWENDVSEASKIEIAVCWIHCLNPNINMRIEWWKHYPVREPEI